MGFDYSDNRSQRDADWNFADCHQTPSCDQQLAGQRHDHFRFAGVSRTFCPRTVPLSQSAILLEP
jgi:hypothetical protein